MLLEQRILDLQKDKGALIDKVRELKKELKIVPTKEIKENGKWEEETQIKKLLLCSKYIEEQTATEV